MIEDVEMVREMETVGVTHGTGNLPDLVGELGFVAVMNNAIG